MGNSAKEMLTFIDSKLKGRTVGYAIAIYQGTDLVLSTSGGSAVLSPETKMTSNSRSLVGSMSKTITAAITVALLQSKNLTVDTFIAPYLPSSWKLGPNVKNITFRMLLTHTSGLPNGGWDYSSLKGYIANGFSGTLPAGSAYSNSAYCLLRVMVSYLLVGQSGLDPLEASSTINFPKFLGDRYVQLFRDLYGFDMSGVDVVPNGPKPFTVYYNFARGWNTPTITYQIPADNRLYAGAGGWIMSAREYGRFLTRLQFGKHSSVWQTMRDTVAPSIFEPEPGWVESKKNGIATSRLGMWRFPGKEGFYFGHNGEQGTFGPFGASGFGGWMVYPNGTTAVLLANSEKWFPEDQDWGILMPAYDS